MGCVIWALEQEVSGFNCDGTRKQQGLFVYVRTGKADLTFPIETNSLAKSRRGKGKENINQLASSLIEPRGSMLNSQRLKNTYPL